MKNKILTVTVLLCFAITGCGKSTQSTQDDMVSIDDYKRVVDERDYYKEQYEKLLNADNSSDTSSSEYNGETQMIVDVTPDNFGDYFEYVLIDLEEKASFYDEELYAFVPKSKVFDDGWVYIDVSRDFELTCTTCQRQIDEGWSETRASRIEIINSFPMQSDKPEFTLIDVKGQIMFERMESLERYEIDTFKLKRIVRTQDGKGSSTDLKRNQLDIQY